MFKEQIKFKNSCSQGRMFIFVCNTLFRHMLYLSGSWPSRLAQPSEPWLIADVRRSEWLNSFERADITNSAQEPASSDLQIMSLFISEHSVTTHLVKSSSYCVCDYARNPDTQNLSKFVHLPKVTTSWKCPFSGAVKIFLCCSEERCLAVLQDTGAKTQRPICS